MKIISFVLSGTGRNSMICYCFLIIMLGTLGIWFGAAVSINCRSRIINSFDIYRFAVDTKKTGVHSGTSSAAGNDGGFPPLLVPWKPRVTAIAFGSESAVPSVPSRTVNCDDEPAGPAAITKDESDSYQIEKDGCVAVSPWQLGRNPTCNIVHELDLSDCDTNSAGRRGAAEGAELVAHGNIRSVWKVVEYDGQTSLAVKTARINTKERHWFHEIHRREAVAMDRLARSEYVTNIHGHCAVSGIFDYNDDGDGGGVTLQERAEARNFTSREKLRVSFQVAKAVADVHDPDGGGRVAMVIADLKSDQFVYNGKYDAFQIVDLNFIMMMAWNAKTHEQCSLGKVPSGGWIQSPEGYNHTRTFTEKIDIFALGGILHSIITGRYPFQGEVYSRNGWTEVRDLVLKGVRPPSYDLIQRRGDPFELAVLEAVNNTRRLKSEDRWSAKEVVSHLGRAMAELT